jgi:beta-1,4-mannosyl-glycoprotein beta-1,4-N-acetylglucosaminyltransferase
MVIDCSLYFNEAELFRLRYTELRDTVDMFVVVEGLETFTGHFKDLNFPDEYKKLPGVVYWPVNIPKQRTAWESERIHRDSLGTALSAIQNLADDDVIILSDADEIVHPNAIAQYKRLYAAEHQIVVCEQLMSYYFLNMRSDTTFQGTRITTVKGLRDHCSWSMEKLRYARGPVLSPGGWHFSFMGGVQRIQQKLQSYAHTEYSGPKWSSEAYITRMVTSALDLFNREIKWSIVPIDKSFPLVVQYRQDEFAHMIRKEPPHAYI